MGGGNPKLGYDNCPSLYNDYNRKSCKRLLIINFVNK
jgi:hypothetical protein